MELEEGTIGWAFWLLVPPVLELPVDSFLSPNEVWPSMTKVSERLDLTGLFLNLILIAYTYMLPCCCFLVAYSCAPFHLLLLVSIVIMIC